MKNTLKQFLCIVCLFALTVYFGFMAYNSEVKFSEKKMEADSSESSASSNLPAVKYTTSKIITQYSNFDPMSVVDTDKYAEVTYNNVNTAVPGDYTVVIKVCQYRGSTACRSVTSSIRVKAKTTTTTTTSNKTNSNKYQSTTTTKNYYAGPVFKNKDKVTCNEGSKTCLTSKISKPTATDPYSGRKLNVTLIDGNVNIYVPGTYNLIYEAYTEHGVRGTVAKLVVIEEVVNNNYNNNYNYNYNNNYLPETKYISNYHSEYYNDGTYAGYLKADYNSKSSKYISNYSWTNKVYYTYRCVNVGEYGTDGWEYVSTDSSDNHPTYYYNIDGYRGTLEKTDFMCAKGCTQKLIDELGRCNYYNSTKQITRTWIGYYSGYVYSNYNQTYSGTVYLK